MIYEKSTMHFMIIPEKSTWFIQPFYIAFYGFGPRIVIFLSKFPRNLFDKNPEKEA